MTDLRKAANMALRALDFNYPLIEDYGNKEQLDIHHEAIMALCQALAQPDETETLKRCLFQMQEAAKALAQPEPVVSFTDNEEGLWIQLECNGSYYSQNLSESKTAKFFVNAYRGRK